MELGQNHDLLQLAESLRVGHRTQLLRWGLKGRV